MKRAPIGRPFFVHPAWPKVSQKNPNGLAGSSLHLKACTQNGGTSQRVRTNQALGQAVLLAHGDHVVASAVVIPVIIAGCQFGGDLGWLGRLATVGLWLGFPCAGGVLVAFGFLEAC